MYTLRMLNPETRATLEALREEQKSQKMVNSVGEGTGGGRDMWGK